MTSSTFTGETGSQAVETSPGAIPGSSRSVASDGSPRASSTAWSACSPSRSPRRDGPDEHPTGSGEASQLGAVAEDRRHVVRQGRRCRSIAIGLLLYVLWRLVSIVLPAENSAKAWAHPRSATSSAP